MSDADLPSWLPQHGEVIDVGGAETIKRIHCEAHSALGERRALPKELAYTDSSVEWQQVGTSEGYYQTTDEIQILSKNQHKIKRFLEGPDGIIIIWEIGSGDFLKGTAILNCLRTARRRVIYMATDISPNLSAGVANLAKSFASERVHIAGLFGSDQDGLKFLSPRLKEPCTVLDLGSHFFNKPPSDAEKHAEIWRPFFAEGHQLMVGHDGHGANHREKIMFPYRNSVASFVFKNSRNVYRQILGEDVLSATNWATICELQDQPSVHHVISLEANKELTLGGTKYGKGDRIDMFTSWKYRPSDIHSFGKKHGLAVAEELKAEGSETYIYLAAPVKKPLLRSSKL